MKNGPYELVVAEVGYPGKKYRDKYAYEHHQVWWKKTGLTLPKGFVIHHKDHNHRNNHISNLIIMTNSEHCTLHKTKPDTKIKLTCSYCGTEFEREKSDINFKTKIGQKRFYCSRNHGRKNISKKQFHLPPQQEGHATDC